MSFFRNLFGLGPKVDMADLIQNRKAYIVDVRTPGEFKNGHIKGSVNIPLQSISGADKKLKGKEPIVLCCASGARSGQATSMLKSKGFTEVYNGGSWHSVKRHTN
jgi:rhodanese-related sulfurtransferase